MTLRILCSSWDVSLFRVQNRPYFDDAAGRERGDTSRDGDRFVPIPALDQMVAAQLLLRFGKRPVHEKRVAAALAYGDGAAGGIQLGAAQQLASLLEVADELAILVHDPVALGGREFQPPGLFETAQQQELHRF